jgi:hypothetical protein
MTAPNQGKPWKSEEINLLLINYSKQLSIDEIAKIHGRTNNAIECKLREIIYEFYSEEKPIEEISYILNIEPEKIQREIQKYKLKLDKEKVEKSEKHEETNLIILKSLKNISSELNNLIKILENH